MGNDIDHQPAYDQSINAEMQLQQGNEMKNTKVIRRSPGHDGKNVDTYSSIPIHNTIIYDVMFTEGAIKEYAANVSAENMMA